MDLLALLAGGTAGQPATRLRPGRHQAFWGVSAMNVLCGTTMNQANLQNVRLFIDVLLLGPMMIYYSYQPGPSKLVREFFFWAGTGTIALNAINYLCVEEAMKG